MTRELAIKATNLLAEIEGIERAKDALPVVGEFEDIEKSVYDKLYAVLKEAKMGAGKRLEEL